MTPYSALLGLRDPDRSSLNLSPAADADLFVDIDGLASQVRDWLGVGAPKGAVYGTYGTGKSHLLQYVARTLAPDRRFRSVYVELTGFGRKATFFDVHLRVMNVLLPVLEQLAKHREARRWLAASNLASDDVKRAVTNLGDPALSPTALATTRAWILGTGPTPTQARKEGFTGRLFERSSAVDLVKIGVLMRDGGAWQGRQILPVGWVETAGRRFQAEGRDVGLGWFLIAEEPGPTWSLRGFQHTGDSGAFLVVLRDSGIVAHLFDERNPAVKKLLSNAIQACNKAGKYIGICGQGPSDHPDLARWLTSAGPWVACRPTCCPTCRRRCSAPV